MECPTMQSLTLTGAAMLAAALMTGCGADSGPTAENIPSLAANVTDHNTTDHFRYVEPVNWEVENPCNGELIAFAGESIIQMTAVDTREHLDAGFWLHLEFQANSRATGTGPETGASYVIKDLYHERFNSPDPTAPQSTFSFHGTQHVTSNLPGLSFDGRFLFHFVALPTGGFKVTQEVGDVECKG
jgi:hypothetical protein